MSSLVRVHVNTSITISTGHLPTPCTCHIDMLKYNCFVAGLALWC